MSLFLSKQKLILVTILLEVFGLLILTTQKDAVLSTFLLFSFVTIIGLILCKRLRVLLNDQNLNILGYFWLIKLAITFILLFAGWIPRLNPSSADWGYDPQRYYFQSQELVDNHWMFNGGLNYVGIVYFYGAIFTIFGHNPVIPALINSFVTLIASLFLIKVGYQIKSHRDRHDWKIAWVLLLPEILWFDVMTSRETILGAFIIFALLTTGIYLLRNAAISLPRLLIVVGLSLLAISAIRTSMLIPVLTAIILMTFTIKQQGALNITKKIILIILTVLLLLEGPIFSVFLGSSKFDILNSLQTRSVSQDITTELYNGSKNSIGMLLLPEGIIQSILFLPPRMVLYLVAPLPYISISVIDMWKGSWQDWQKLFTSLSSLINILAMPYVLASLVQSIKNRKKNSALLIFNISYWVTFIAISGGNLIIHERYRVMSTILFFGCAWLGARTCSRKLISRTAWIWYGLLSFGAFFYISYKFIY